MKRPTALILIILAIALFYLFTRGQYEEAKELQARADEYKNVIENVERIAETRDRLLVNYESIPSAELARLAKALPDNVDTVSLALDLEAIAARYGISIDNIQVDDSSKSGSLPVLSEYAPPYEKVTISFGFVSNYNNFVGFLADLEKSLRIMDVREASFQASDAGLYEHSLTIDTYWLK